MLDHERVCRLGGERCKRGWIGGAEIVELEVPLPEGANHAVFGRSAGIERQRQTGAGNEVVAEAVLLAEVTAPGRLPVDAAVEGGVGAQIAADLDAGVGAGDEEEARAVKRANPDIFYRFGLDRKVGRFVCRRSGQSSLPPS